MDTESEMASATTALLYFPANDGEEDSSSQSPQLPPPLRRRLLDPKTPSSPTATSQDIETKLRHAQLRREQFYELLSSKARPKLRSPARSSLQEGLGQRLEAKLYAAKQKRLSILANVRNRLSRRNELRQAAKNGVELRLDKERADLCAKVESRVQKAEANRMLLLRACRQKRIAKEERIVQLLMKRLIQEKKYKEFVWASIHRKRAAAEKKRLGVLEAEKSRVRARVLQVQHKAIAVQNKQESERWRRKNQLEAKLLRAKRLRMDHLRRRANLYSSAQASSSVVACGNLLSTKLARCWKQFVNKGTTFALAKAYAALEINEKAVKSVPFEQLASKIEASASIRTAKTLLDRLEKRIAIKQEVTRANNLFSLERVDHLLKHVISPGKTSGGGVEKGGFGKVGQDLAKVSRYPVRVVFCAYMILGHPDAVLSGRGEYEIALAKSAKTFIEDFEMLINIILKGPVMSSLEETRSSVGSLLSFRSQLERFDKAWCFYLKSFVTWKAHDAKLLEEDFVRAVRQLELNIMQTNEQSSENCSHLEGGTKADKKVISQVTENRKFVREHMQQLSVLSSAESSQSAMANNSREDATEAHHRVLQKPMTDDLSTNNEGSSAIHRKTMEGHSPEGAIAVADNEVLVNEIVHGHKRGLYEGLSIISKDKKNLKALVKDKMEQAFWDGVLESMQQNESDYSWVLKLMKEVRDELCAMSPSSWRQEIVGAIDVDILSQILDSGILDMNYLGRILDFAMVTLQKLSAPANETELKAMHQKLLKELNEISQAEDFDAPFAHLMIKGLRVVLQQIQRLKHDVSKARIAMLEPLIKGPAGLEYLKSAFAKRYGAPTDASTSLPLVVLLFSAVVSDSEQEWKDYLHSVSTLSSAALSPSMLRTGSSILKEVKVGGPTTIVAGDEQPECKGEKVDLLLRLGLLRLVSKVEGLEIETLPETLKLNLFRLRDVQSQLQKIIVISSSILVLRQTFLSERLMASSIDMENTISKCVKHLSELLDNSEDVGASEVIETMNCFLEGDELGNCQSKKELMSSMLAKSLRAGDSVFSHVSRTVYLAARGVVLGGSGMKGKQLAKAVLKRIGASLLTERLVEAMEELLVISTMSARIHRSWYEQVLVNIQLDL